MEPFKTCQCGISFTKEGFDMLEYVGLQTGTHEGKRFADDIVLRLCLCGSTIGVPVEKEAA